MLRTRTCSTRSLLGLALAALSLGCGDKSQDTSNMSVTTTSSSGSTAVDYSGQEYPGMDPASWELATALPAAGDAMSVRTVVGGVTSGDSVTAHLSNIFLNSDGQVLCAVTWPVTSSSVATDSSCEAAWVASFGAAVDHGTPFCTDAPGYNILATDLSSQVGFGYGTSADGEGELCTKEELMEWAVQPGYTWLAHLPELFAMDQLFEGTYTPPTGP